MPKYEYIFYDGTIVEVEQSIREDRLKTLQHPKTGEIENVTRLLPKTFALEFKGGGWTPKGGG